MSLDPSRQAAKVTRAIARQLADVAVQLEEAGHPAEAVDGFLTGCLFTFFAEDVELIPKRSLGTLLDSLIKGDSMIIATTLLRISCLFGIVISE